MGRRRGVRGVELGSGGHADLAGWGFGKSKGELGEVEWRDGACG